MTDLFAPVISSGGSALGSIYNPTNPALALFTTQSENPTDAGLGLYTNSGFGNLNFSNLANDNTNSGYMYAVNDPTSFFGSDTLGGQMLTGQGLTSCGLSLSCYGQAFVRGANRLAGGAIGQSASQSDAQGLLGGFASRGIFLLVGALAILGGFLLFRNREVIISSVKNVATA